MSDLNKVSDKNKVYVLLLNNGKYYIGKTDNIVNRISDHKNGQGAQYTKKHGVNDLVEIKLNCSIFEEENTVIEYMYKYGIENVRGGIYCSENISQNEMNDIKKRIASVYDFCYICNKKGHYAYECSSMTKEIDKNHQEFVNNNILIDDKKNTLIDDDKNTLIDDDKNTIVNNNTQQINIIPNIVEKKVDHVLNDTKQKYGKKWSKEEEKILIDRLKNNIKYTEIASELGRSYYAIKMHVIDMIYINHKKNISYETIGTMMGLNKAYVRKIIENPNKKY